MRRMTLEYAAMLVVAAGAVTIVGRLVLALAASLFATQLPLP